ncbi:MAG: hypothetical protein V3R67_08855 [Thermodesulfobacteriota bacterium]
MNRIQRKFVLDALDQEHNLNEWESQFISDLTDRDEINPDNPLTNKQNEVLNRISQKLD